MNDHDQTPDTDQPNSLLKRLLDQDPEPRTPEERILPPPVQPFPPDAIVSPIPGYTIPAHPDAPLHLADDGIPLSPIRPTVPENGEAKPAPRPITPTPPRTPPERVLSPRERMQQAEDALINLRQKMAHVAAEFAEGTLNQAQFDAIYKRYSEQRAITERLLTRDPQSQAWQSVIRPGHTQFLKQYFTARPLSYAIYDQTSFAQITLTGRVQLRQPQIEAVLKRLRAVITLRGNPGPTAKKLPDGKCVVIVPGALTVTVVIFSLEPAAQQIDRIRDMHNDFERANRRALSQKDYSQTRMVFPHRALFETGNLG